MSTELLIALVSFVGGLITVIFPYILSRKKSSAEIEGIKAEAEKARLETKMIKIELARGEKTELADNISIADEIPIIPGETPSEIIASVYYTRGMYYYHRKEYTRAIDALTLALQFNPREPIYFIARGQAYYDMGDGYRCVLDETAAINLDPNNADYYWRRGNTYYYLKNYGMAEKDYNKALSLEPTQAQYYKCLADCLASQQKYSDAIANYDKAIEINPNPLYYSNRGKAYLNVGDYDRAVKDFSQCLRLEQCPRCYLERGKAHYYKVRDKMRAKVRDFSGVPWFANATEWDKKEWYKELDEAISDFSDAISMGLQSAYYWRGSAFYRYCTIDASTKYARLALDDLNKAIEVEPNDGWCYYMRALVYLYAREKHIKLVKSKGYSESEKEYETNYESDFKQAVSLGCSEAVRERDFILRD